jgi:hypothetical protein
MKRIFIHSLCVVVLSALAAGLLAGCGSANAGKDPHSASNAAADGAASSGKGTISCTINGKPVSIVVTNAYFPITLNTDTKGPADGLELLDGSAQKEGFQFEIKDHGTTNIRGGADDILCLFTYFDKAGATYVGKDVTVTVSAFSGNHLTGTFAGKFEKSVGDNLIAITDGKFDLVK